MKPPMCSVRRGLIVSVLVVVALISGTGPAGAAGPELDWTPCGGR